MEEFGKSGEAMQRQETRGQAHNGRWRERDSEGAEWLMSRGWGQRKDERAVVYKFNVYRTVENNKFLTSTSIELFLKKSYVREKVVISHIADHAKY